MAPQTNIGSSTPITGTGANIGGDLRRKVVNDAAASLRALSKSHGRNAKWADEAVRKASNLTAAEALRMNVIDMIAPTLPALLEKSDGYKTVPKGYTLHLAGAQIDEVSMGFFDQVLNTLLNPNLISLLFLAGIAGIGFEIFHPGVVFPGALGAVALVIALFGFSVLPFSWAGILLILLGIASSSRTRTSRATARSRSRGWSASRRGAAPLPQRAGAVHDLRAARDLARGRPRRLLGVRDRQGGPGAAPARSASARRR